MMKYILTILIFISITASSFSQWVQQNSGTNVTLYDIEMVNENTGWICGAGGLILKTTNGGDNWINIPNPASGKPLLDIDIVDDSTMYCVGFFETIIKSTDTGANWFAIRNGPSGMGGSYYTCSFINEQTGWICGGQQKVMKTTDGGQTLDSIYLFVANMFNIYFKNPTEGVVTGEGSIVRKSSNGGINWYQVNISLPTNQPGFQDFCFLNSTTGFMPARDGRVFKTTDFGNNWDSVTFINIGIADIRTVDFINFSTGFVGGSDARLYKTTDGGQNWIRENIGFLSIAKLRFVNDSTGWAVGTSGRIFKTTTGGDPIVGISNNHSIVDNFELQQNYPNPFNNSTSIKYSVNRIGYFKLEIFDINGRLMKEVFSQYKTPGSYSVIFESDLLSSGVYFYRLSSILNSQTKKFLLIK